MEQRIDREVSRHDAPMVPAPGGRGTAMVARMSGSDLVAAVVLAAGKGTRMGSDQAKVLHCLAGRPLVTYPLAVARTVGATRVVVVVGHQKEAVIAAVRSDADGSDNVRFAEQTEQLGTGHAVQCALQGLEGFDGVVVILSGDVPLVTEASLRGLITACQTSGAGLAAATFEPEDPTGYGRMLRGPDGGLIAIREHKDANEAERRVTECNAGIYCVNAQHLRDDLPRIGRGNAQNEIYLTDLVELGAGRGSVAGVPIPLREATGINTQAQLAQLEAELA